MNDLNFRIAPIGRYRVIEINEQEEEFSSFEGDYTEILEDCDTLKEATELMHRTRRPYRQRLIYDDQGNCLDDFRIGKSFRSPVRSPDRIDFSINPFH